MEDKSVIINKIIKDNRYKVYLEIGYGTGHNYGKILPNLNKDAVEPAYKGSNSAVYQGTSDEFFAQNEQTYDVIFIDGDHIAEQVRKDIVNSLKVLTDGGCIILHDSLPKNKEMQDVPRKTKQFTGDVWKAIVGFTQAYPDVKIETYRSDYGLSVIYPEGFKGTRKHFEKIDMTFEEFKENSKELLNIVD